MKNMIHRCLNHLTLWAKKGMTLSTIFLGIALCLGKQIEAQSLVWNTNHSLPSTTILKYQVATNANGYFVASTQIDISGTSSLYIAKYSSAGVLLSSRSLTLGSLEVRDMSKLLVNSSGMAYVMLTLRYADGHEETMIQAYNANFTFKWTRFIQSDFYDRGADMVFTPSGDILAMINYSDNANSFSDIMVQRLNYNTGAVGLTINTNTFGLASKFAKRIESDASGNFAICGYQDLLWGTQSWQSLLLRYTAAGTLSWVKYYSSTSNAPYIDKFHDLAIDNSGNVFAVGSGNNPAILGTAYAYVKKYNTAGTLLANHNFTTTESSHALFIKFNSSWQPYVIGMTGPLKIWSAKYSTSLVPTYLISRSITYPIQNTAQMMGFILNPNGSVVIAANTATTAPTAYNTLVRFDALGDFSFESNEAGGNFKLTTALGNYPNKEFVTLGTYLSAGQCVLRKYTGPATRLGEEEMLSEFEMLPQVHPNPSQGQFTLTYHSTENADQTSYQLCDMSGRVFSIQPSHSQEISGLYHIRFITSSLENGNYTLIIKNSETVRTTKLFISH